MEHRATLRTIGLTNEASPYLTIVAECSCGVELFRRRYDVRDYEQSKTAHAFLDGETSANMFIEHYLRAHRAHQN